MKRGFRFIAALIGAMGIMVEVIAAGIDDAEMVHLFSTKSDMQLVARYVPIGSFLTGAIPFSLEISPDYKRMAYVADQGDGWFAVVDGIKSSIYTKFDCPDNGCPYTKFIFSADSKRIAYDAQQDDRSFMVVDGKEEKSYASVGGQVFSPDGKRIAYLASQGKLSFVVLDGKEGKKYRRIGGFSLGFSPDSQHIAYVAQSGKKWHVVVDGKEVSTYDEINEPAFCSIFSPDSKRIAYAAKRSNQWFVVLDGKELTPYDQAISPCFSPDSKRIAYLAVRSNRQFIVVDEKESAMEANCCASFSPDSKRITYTSRSKIVVDDKVVNPDYSQLSSFGSLIFSPDSNRVAYKAWLKGENSIIVDDLVGPWFSSAGISEPIFSLDSKRVAYIAHYVEKSNGFDVAHKWYVVVNEGGSNTALESAFRLTNLSFVGDRTLRAIGVRDFEIVRVNFEMEKR
jgi:Tol biopolymer transport system component